MLRFSLKQLLALVTLAALAVVSLKYASPGWQGVVGVVSVIAFFAAILSGIFDRGDRQVFAIGFLVVMLSYELLLLGNRMPTTELLTFLHGSMSRLAYTERATGNEIPEAEAVEMRRNWRPSGPFSENPVVQRLLPFRQHFIPIGHSWFALLFAYCGGQFARSVYLRRIAEQTPAEKGDSGDIGERDAD